MTFAQAIEAMFQHFKDGWEALHPANPAHAEYVPYALDDEDYEPTTLGALGAWVTVAINHTVSNRLTFGSKKYERLGFIQVQIFTPLNQGSALVTRLAGDAATVLESQTIATDGSDDGRVLTYEASPPLKVADKAWTARAVSVRFRYTETRA